jgi:hypothetical protein
VEEEGEERRGREVGQDMGGGTRPDEASTYLRVCQNVILERGIGVQKEVSLSSVDDTKARMMLKRIKR